jgi:Carboxypeptidase regulatory-like domain/TonB-dependent Receptor Plug Domain
VRVTLAVLILVFLFSINCVFAQSPNASITGIVFDPGNKTIAGAEIIAVNDLTGVQYVSSTSGEGIYTVANLPPGSYRIQVSKFGFKAIIKPDIILNVQDALSLNFTLPIGAASVVVTVEGGAPLLNTQNAAVSTVVDRNFIENMPLNGRSFQDLILLTPGVVTNSPQNPSFLGSTGEFSVNGQRTESNNYNVDGVSANIGAVPGSVGSSSGSGSLPSSTALGTTQALVSVDALEEFRIQSSSYSAEYGRNPGGQFTFVTRSGTNQWHGTAFDYLRNNFFDANDWFNNYYGQPQAALRQNDFGGTLGGPVDVPHLYSGKDKTFFFFSYEGLRLIEPQAASVSYVPTPQLRQSVPIALQPVMNAFPLPNCPNGAVNCSNDFGNGLGEFVGTWSNPSSIDAYSIRLDHALNSNHRVFFRFSDTSSATGGRSGGNFQTPSVESTELFTTRTYTLGLTSILPKHVSNDVRLNFSTNEAAAVSAPTDFAGSNAVNLFTLQGLETGQPAGVEVVLLLPGGAGYFPALTQTNSLGKRHQYNVVDGLSVSAGRHQLKFGIDYRRLDATGEFLNPSTEYVYESISSLQSNAANLAFGEAYARVHPYFQNFSAYGQDEWRVAPHVVLSFGLRWEVNPAPGASEGNLPYTVAGGSLATLTLAPQGTPLWETGWHNLAPRLGIAYVFHRAPGFESVLRAGGGVFFDTGQQYGAVGYNGPGFSATNVLIGSVGFPGPIATLVPEIVNPPVAPYGTTYAFPTHFQLPYTWQTNLSLEQALGKAQALTVSYVGGFGRKLMELNQVYANAINPQFSGYLFFTQNGLTSDYNALQVQFQRRHRSGLQFLASYTLSHSIDYGSFNNSLPYVRGNSDFDVRNNFSAAVSYDLPEITRNAIGKVLLRNWSLDDRFMARSGFPVSLLGDSFIDPATGQTQSQGLDLVPGQPIYVYGAQYPGGRAINVNAFANGPSGELGDAPRNFARGFGAWQMDLAIRREFPIGEKLKLQFRAEAFNVFNHPSFGTINSSYAPNSPTFGTATATLAQSLGVLSPLYQMGGPRSMQFALKLVF